MRPPQEAATWHRVFGRVELTIRTRWFSLGCAPLGGATGQAFGRDGKVTVTHAPLGLFDVMRIVP